MRFMHMADVHLGAAPDGRAGWSETRKKEIWETFRSSIEDARREQVDLLLIAGDLFHRQPLLEELKEVNYLFSRECECVRFSDIDTEVYGFSYYRQEILEPLYEGIHPVKEREKCCRILLAHGGDSQHIPINRDSLRNSGFDYIALGHIHKPQTVWKEQAAYAGALEPIDCNDLGPHGYILGEYTKGRIRIRFVKKAKREYIVLPLEVTEGDTTFSLRDKLEKKIEERGWQHIYRITLQGRRDPQTHFDTEKLMEFGMVLEVEDQTVPAFHLEELKRKYAGQMIGRYIESFEGHERSLTEEKALQYGLEALLSQE